LAGEFYCIVARRFTKVVMCAEKLAEHVRDCAQER